MLDHGRIFLCGLLWYGSVLVARAADTGYLRTTIQTHFSQNRHHLVNPDYKLAAQNFIKAEFTRFGLEVITQDFTGVGHQDLTGRKFTNVIGILKGSRFGQADDAISAIGAHYDSFKTTSGVDDNGAGVAAMLETAKRLTSEYSDIKNTVIFGAFDIEEYLFSVDAIGSQQLVTVWLPAWLQQNYGSAVATVKFNGVIILDTVMNYNNSAHAQKIPGEETATVFLHAYKDIKSDLFHGDFLAAIYSTNGIIQFQTVFPQAYKDIKSDQFQGDFLAVIYRAATTDSTLASSMHDSWTKGGRPEFEIESFGLPITDPSLSDQNFQDFLRSDHFHFWKNGYDAIFITDSADLRGHMEQCYHHQCDNIAMLTDTNVAFLGKISDTMTDVVGKLSEGTRRTSAAPSLRYSAFLLVLLVLAVFI